MPSGLVRRNLAMEHRHDQLPIAQRRPLVVNVAARERVAVLGAGMQLVPEPGCARLHRGRKVLDSRGRRIGVMGGKTAVEFALEPVGQAVRRILAARYQRRAVQARGGLELIGKQGGGAHDQTSAEAEADASLGASAYRSIAGEELE